MKKVLLGSFLLFGVYFGLQGQNVGVSFSFFFPQGGDFSIPISPFSYRGVALPFSDYVGIQTGGTVYRMGGLGIKNFEFESDESEYGPNITLYVPLELYLQFGNSKSTFSLKGGVFGFYGVFNKLNYGVIDRAIVRKNNWEVANADFTFKNRPGWGYQGGIEWLIQVSRKFALTFEVNYLMGGANLNLEGTYIGGTNGSIQTYPLNSPDAQVNFSGLEISIGGQM